MALRYEPRLLRITDGAAGGTPIRCTEATYKHNLEGVDELTITTTERLDYTDRILFLDRMGEWHEMMFDTGKHGHEAGDMPAGTVKLYSSVNELWDSYTLDKKPSGTVAAVMASVLGGTRWQMGQNVDVDGTCSFFLYHKSVRECIKEVCEAFGCFFRPRIVVQNSKVIERRIDVFRELGETPKRFTWTKDLTSIYREVGDEKPKTRIYGWGKGVETDSGGHGRRLSFAYINDDKAYVEDEDATAAFGYVASDGTRMPLEGDYVNEQCDDPWQLLAETRAYLKGVSQPSVRYTADVISLADFGREWENVEVGQTATIIDKEFSDEGLRLRGQIAEMSEDLIHKKTVVTFGTITDILTARHAYISQQLASVRNQSPGWQVAASAGPSWLQLLMNSLNDEFNAVGTYKFSSFEQGDIWSSVPLDENGRATKTGGWAININGLGFRMASSLNPDGSWNWRTFGTGEGFSADAINTGTLDATLVTIKDLMRIGDLDGAHASFSASGMEVYDGEGNSAAFFGIDSNNRSYARVGKVENFRGNIEMKARYYNSMSIILRSGTYEAASINYGPVVKNGGYSGWNGAYFTFGNRTNEVKPGNNSMVIGTDNRNEGEDSLCGGARSVIRGLSDINPATKMSLAFGESCRAYGDYAAALNYYTLAGGYQTAVGRCNVQHNDDTYLFIVGNSYSSNSRSDAMYVDKFGNLWIAGSLTQNSDRRLKEHHAYLGEDAVEFVRALKPALYTKDGERHVGFYAQDVREAEPDGWDTATVTEQHTDESLGFDPLTLDYSALIAPLVTYAQSLEKRIEALEARLA